MKAIIRKRLERIPAPWPVLIEDAYRYVRYSRIRRERRVQRRILRRLDEPARVAQGPFRGMSYITRAYCSTILPKLLGTYECELAGAIEAICGAGCDRIVDVGAAEGYYAVGMALRNPEATMICFELSPSARYYLRKLARRNGVLDRIADRGECTVEALGDALAGARRPAVICDCEGAEGVLLDPARAPGLRGALILVETHEGMVPGVERLLIDRFTPTHDVERIESRPRRREDLPGGVDLSPEETAAATDEYRRQAEWMFLRPRSLEHDTAGPPGRRSW